MADVLDDIVLRLIEAGCPVESVKRVERETRQIWGGDDAYIGKRTVEMKASAVGAALCVAGTSIAEAFANAGVPRRTGFRLLNRRRRPA
jgi:hypothetical protein